MNVSKFLGLIFFLIIVSTTHTPANGQTAATKKSSKCRCPVKKNRVVSLQADFNPSPVSLPQPRKRCPGESRQQVSFKLRSSETGLRAYPFIEDDGERIYYCVGLEERFQYKRDLLDVRVGARQSVRGAEQPLPDGCVPATNALRAMATVRPEPADVPEQTRPVEKVILTVIFYEDGTVGPIGVEQSPSPQHSASARRAAQNIRFNPAWENGKSVCVAQTVEYVFRSRPDSRKSSSDQRIILLEPTSGQILNNQPRLVRFAWQPISGANDYLLEVEYSLLTSPAWVGFRKVPGRATTRELEFPGPYAGRWRVAAMRQDGTRLADSNWSYFGYDK